MRVGHPESRAGLATVQCWNRVRAADLLYPTPPHNLVMPSWSRDRAHTHTHTLVLASIDGLHSTTDLIFQRGHLSAVSQQPWFWYLWASFHPPIRPSPKYSHYPTLNLSVWLRNIIFLVASPKLHMITRATHNQNFQPKPPPNQPYILHSEFIRKTSSDDQS